MQGKWKATTQSREFLKSIKRYYSNAYTDGEKQDVINLCYFQPREGKPALWELDSDYYLHVSGIVDDLFIPDNSSLSEAKLVGARTTFAPISACRDDFSRLKLTSFDKLIERTCSSIHNVRLFSEPDHKPWNSGVAPDAAEIQLKSPNWLFGQRKYEESNCAPKVASQETANGRCQDEKRVDGLCDLKWLSFSGDVNEKDVFKRVWLGPLKDGLLISVDSLCEIDGVLIGLEFCKVFVLKANKPNVVLETTFRCLRTVGEAVGRYIVWRSIHVQPF
ncbi:unnamed protein product [Camellia sinensis]